MDEKIRLVLETLGVDNVRQATQALKDMEQAAGKVDDEIVSGVIKSTGQLFLNLKDGQRIAADSKEGMEKLAYTMNKFMVTSADGTKTLRSSVEAIDEAYRAQKRYEEQIWRSSQSVDDLQESHVDLFRTIQSRGGPAMDAHVEAFKKHREATEQNQRTTQAFGQRVLEASYALDDLQYGFRGIVNNVPGIARAFGLSASVIGGVGIAAVALNQVFQLLGPLFESTEKPLKPLNERLDEFAKGMGQSAVETEKLKNQIDAMAKTSVPGLFTELYKSVKSIRELIEAQKELNQMKEEDDQRQKQRETESKAIEEGLNKDKTKGQLVDEFLGNADTKDNANRLAGIQDTLAKDEIQRAINEKVDEELAAMEARGDFGEYTFLPAAQKAMKQTRAQLMKQTGPNDPAVIERARRIAGGKMNAARGGDEQAIREIEALLPDLAGFMEGDEADKAFFGGLSDRSKAIRNRDERRAKLAGELANNPPLPPDMERRRMDAAAIAAGEKTGAAMLPNGAMFDAELSRRALAAQAKSEAEMAKDAAIRNQVLGMADPAQMAAARMYQASQFGPGRNRVLKQLQERDTNIYANALSERGMSPAAAQEAAQESIAGGNRQFAEFADSIGKNLGSNLRAQEAAAQYMMRMGTNVDENTARLEALTQQLNASGAGNTPNVRPPSRARN